MIDCALHGLQPGMERVAYFSDLRQFIEKCNSSQIIQQKNVSNHQKGDHF